MSEQVTPASPITLEFGFSVLGGLQCVLQRFSGSFILQFLSANVDGVMQRYKYGWCSILGAGLSSFCCAALLPALSL